MRLEQLRRGERVALVGAVALLVLLFFDWVGLDLSGVPAPAADEGSVLSSYEAGQSGWAALGWFLDLLLVALIAGGLAVPVLAVTMRAPAWPVAVCVLVSSLGSLIVVVLGVVLLLQPGLDAGLPNALVDIRLPAILGFVAALLIPVGAFAALDDDRTELEARSVTPPPARPVPGT